MKMPISLWVFLIPFFSILFMPITCTPVVRKCQKDEKILLLHFRASLKYNSSLSTKLVHWNGTEDCCYWGGVECNSYGHVIGLELSFESIAGEIDDSSSLFSLKYLEKLNLASNELVGAFPKKIFQVPTLKSIDLSGNKLLYGSLPEFLQNGALQSLDLSYTQFSGKLPDSIGNLRMLSSIELSGCKFIGQLPGSIRKLTQLTSLALNGNKFTGSIPSLRLCKNLTFLILDENNLSGEFPPSYWQGLDNLAFLSLYNNSFSGAIPRSLFSLPSIQIIDLSNNRFSQIGELKNIASHQLYSLNLGGNKFEGPIPEFLFRLKGLEILSLSGNKFMGTLELSKFGIFKKLRSLDLSHNMLSINARSSGPASSPFPQYTDLLLASCNIQEFPDLKNQSRLTSLDLSDNKITGQIPNWIWEVGSGGLSFNLSHNQFSGLQEPYRFPSFFYTLDLHSNVLQGSIPKPSPQAYFLDYSSNKFGSYIPSDIGNFLSTTFFFSIANNKLVGVIPQSIGNASQISVLNFSHNELEGTIPPTIGNMKQLESLDLSFNKLSGTIPGQLANLTYLSSLNLSYNKLVGKIPQGSRFQAFTEKSFVGNKGLCGSPLKKRCNPADRTPRSSLGDRKRSMDNKHNNLALSEELH